MAPAPANDQFDVDPLPSDAWAYARHTRRPVLIRSRPVPPVPIVNVHDLTPGPMEVRDWCFAAVLAIVFVGWITMMVAVLHHFCPWLFA